MNVVIEKGIPVPSKQNSTRYPFADMEIGDSFFAPDKTVVLVHANARRYMPKKFTCRTMVEDGVKGVRVWRIA